MFSNTCSKTFEKSLEEFLDRFLGESPDELLVKSSEKKIPQEMLGGLLLGSSDQPTTILLILFPKEPSTKSCKSFWRSFLRNFWNYQRNFWRFSLKKCKYLEKSSEKYSDMYKWRYLLKTPAAMCKVNPEWIFRAIYKKNTYRHL